MASPRFRAYIAASLDGLIADRDGGVGWLEPFNDQDYGYDEFLGNIGLIVSGRATFDQSLAFPEWPYGDTPVRVLTRTPLPEGVPATVQAVHGTPEALAARAEADCGQGDVWVLGGGRLLAGLMAAGRVDELELFLMPLLLGDGIPLFPPSQAKANLDLREVTRYENGVVRLLYGVERP